MVAFAPFTVNWPKFTMPAPATVMSPAPELKLAVPLTVSVSALSASEMLVPVNVAFPASITTLAPAASVMLPADVSTKLSPVLEPVSTVSLSSVMLTAPPVVLNVKLPKFTVAVPPRPT